MANFINYIIESSIQPVKTNVLWIKNGVPYYFNEKWKPLLGVGSGGGSTSAFPIIMGEHYNSAILRDSNNKAFGESSVALGKSVTTNNIGEAAFGKFNKSTKSDISSEASLFTIGNGTSNIFKNVFEVKYDGSIYIEGLDYSIQEYLKFLNTENNRIESEITKKVENLDGTVTEHSTQIIQTSKEIKSVAKSVETIDSKVQEHSTSITQTAEKVETIAKKTTQLENKTVENESKITQTAKNITSEVSRLETKYDGELNTVKDTVTSIDQKADKINLRVDSVNQVTDGLQTQVTENKSAINQTNNSIELLVEENKTFSDRIEKAEADIKVNTDNIALNVKQTEFDLLAGKVDENTSSININTNNIESKVAKETFNAYTGEVDNRFTVVDQTIEGVTTTVRANTGKITEVETSISGLTVKTGTLEAAVESLQKQSDGSIDTYFGNETPTLDNEPAVNWLEEERKQHTGDIYYNNATGEAFRFSYDSKNNSYFWNKLTDSALIEALESISKLEGSIDGKSTTYVKDITDSSENYKLGDLWILPTNLGVYEKGTLLTCIKDFDLIFNWSDWEELIKYTDDSALDAFVTSYNETIGTIKNQVDKKAETWYQATDPSIDWTTDELKALHTGDLWFDTKDQKTYYWNGNSWEFQNIPIEVFDTLDSKSSIFIEKPTKGYNVGDLWVLETDYELLEGIHKSGTWVVAIRDCEVVNDKFNWNKNDWVKKDRYTDDTALHLFEESYKIDIQNIKTQIDGKAQTWYQSEDPSLNWSEKEKSEHKGDLWYNTNYDTTWYWDGVKWEYQNVPKEVFDSIDGKSSIYVEKPSSYHVNDLWVLEQDYILNNNAYRKGTWVVATESSDIWNPNHWIKKDSYTDDTAVDALNSYVDGAFKDGILEESEKNVIREAKKSFDANFNEIVEEYSTLIITSFSTGNESLIEDLTKSYEELEESKGLLDEAIENLLNHSEDSDKELSELKDEYDEAYVNFVKALQKYRTSVEYLREGINKTLNNANVYIQNIASDSILTPIEKKQLLEIWKNIAEEFNANRGIAFNYKILDKDSEGNYIQRIDPYPEDSSYWIIYKNYQDSFSIVEDIFTAKDSNGKNIWGFDSDDLSKETPAPEGTTINNISIALDNYYKTLAAFSEMISKITIEITDAHEKAKEYVDKLSNQLDPKDEISVIGEGIILSTVIGVKSSNDDTFVSAINASSLNNDEIITVDTTGNPEENHGRVIYAGGIPSNNNWNDSTTVIYEDGHVKFKSGEITDDVSIGENRQNILDNVKEIQKSLDVGGNTIIDGGLVLTTLLGVKDEEGNLKAGLNASNIEGLKDPNEYGHGRVVFAGGIEGNSDWNNARTIIYEDGYVKFRYGEIEEGITLGNAILSNTDAVTNIKVISYPIEKDGKKEFIPLFQINTDENNNVISISSIYDFRVNGNLIAEKEVSAGGAASEEGPSSGGGLDEEELQNYLDEHKYVTEDEVAGLIPEIDLSVYATKTELQNVDNKHTSSISRINGEITEIENDIISLKDTNIAHGESIHQLSESDTKQNTAIQSIEIQVALHNTAIASLGTKNTEQDTTIGQIQQKDEEQDNDIDGIKTRLEAAEKITSLFGEDEKGVYLKNSKNFYTRGEISAGGAASEGGGEGGDVVVGGSLDSLEDVDINEIEIDSTLSAAEKEAVAESQVLSYDSKGVWVNKTTMYIHRQQESAKVWEITHNMNKMPNVKVIDAYGELVFGTIKYDLNNLNRLEIHFGGAFSGRAYLD